MSIFEETRTYRPFAYPWAMEMAIEHSIALYWDTHQISMADDIRQFHTKDGLKTDNVSHEVNQYILTKNLNVFTQMDMAAGVLYCKLLPYVKNNEIRNMWMTFASRESVHQRSYAMIVEELGFPDSSWSEFMEYKEMSDKIELLMDTEGRDLSKPLDFAKTLGQLLLAEGICLFGAFASMLNLKRQGLMMGTNLVNEWSLRDEEKHVAGNIKVLRDIMDKNLNASECMELVLFLRKLTEKFEEAEFKFIDLMFEMGDQEDMTKAELKGYITYLSQLRLFQLDMGEAPLNNPLPWMDWVLSGKQHTNFFEDKVTDYDHSGLVGDIDYSQYAKLIPSYTGKLLGAIDSAIIDE